MPAAGCLHGPLECHVCACVSESRERLVAARAPQARLGAAPDFGLEAIHHRRPGAAADRLPVRRVPAAAEARRSGRLRVGGDQPRARQLPARQRYASGPRAPSALQRGAGSAPRHERWPAKTLGQGSLCLTLLCAFAGGRCLPRCSSQGTRSYCPRTGITRSTRTRQPIGSTLQSISGSRGTASRLASTARYARTSSSTARSLYDPECRTPVDKPCRSAIVT